jgi:glycosyltransferase involved in cell wall biosynthesis
MTPPAAPRALHIVLNAVTEDSRVLKCAWSLGNAGWDVVVAGATPFTHNDQLTIGYASIKRLPLKVVLKQDFIAKVLRKGRYYQRRFQARFLGGYTPGVPNWGRAVKAILPLALTLKPDVLHAHDYTALPIAGEIAAALKKAGHPAQLIYDAHEYVPGVAHLKAPLMRSYTEQEIIYTAESAAVLSVSEGMSELLIPHLKMGDRRPEIVANDPLVEGQQPSVRSLRHDCGITADVPLIVYSGAVAPQRGIGTVIEGLRQMPDVHCALIANPESASVQQFILDAADIADRFHVLPYVPNAELVDYLRAADLGLIPIHHKLNHEISLITKFGEYMQAKLPIVVSDVRTMAAEVRRLGNGEVFIAQDTADFVSAVRKVLSDKSRYQSVYTPTVLQERSWERQAENLLSIYNRIAKVTSVAREHKSFTLSAPTALSN